LNKYTAHTKYLEKRLHQNKATAKVCFTGGQRQNVRQTK